MKEKQYSVALRKRVNGDRFYYHNDFSFVEVKINTKGRYWLADPFLFENNDTTYLFYEAYDLVDRCGYIGYSIVNDDFSCSDPTIIIKSEFHKSFPFIFEKNNEVYIMPESCGENKVKMYKAVKFPDKWVEERILINDIFSTDTILINSNGNDYLLTSEQYRYPEQGKVISCWVKNLMFTKIERDNRINFEYIGKVAEGEEGIRNAGAAFIDDENLIRPGQNCKDGKYGKGLKFFKVGSINPYKEKLIYSVDCDEMWSHINFAGNSRDLLGTHTYNSSDKYEVIDFSFYKNLLPYIVFLRDAREMLIKAYHGIIKAKKLIKKFDGKIKYHLNNKEEIYESEINRSAPWVFVSYIADPFYHLHDDAYLNYHQNKRETLVMARVFNCLGYNVTFMLHTSKKEIPKRNYKFIFGHEPNIIRAKELYPQAKMVYYGVSTYFEYRNNKIKEMTNHFNKEFDTNAPYRRLVKPHNAVENADSILLIGSQNTILTFPDQYRGKITLIHESTIESKYIHYLEVSGSKDFFYMSSAGNILKGCGALIQFFVKHQEYQLHWIGNVEDDVKEVLTKLDAQNIHTYGYQNLNSDVVLGLAERCDFMLYPSGVEGVPGAVLSGMKNGLIPLVTPWASIDGIENLGYVMKDSTEEEVEMAIKWAMSLSADEILERKKKCQKLVLENYNLEKFEQEFEEYMRKIL